MFNILFCGLNAACFFVNQNGNIYVRGLNLMVAVICGLTAITSAIKRK